jgi:hypothetical protein
MQRATPEVKEMAFVPEPIVGQLFATAIIVDHFGD